MNHKAECNKCHKTIATLDIIEDNFERATKKKQPITQNFAFSCNKSNCPKPEVLVEGVCAISDVDSTVELINFDQVEEETYHVRIKHRD